METAIEVTTARPSLLLLNDYCLLEIFEFLEIYDSVNLAKTSNRLRCVADRIWKIHSKFVELDSKMINKGEEYIDHLFQYIGRHVTSLDFIYHSDELRNLSNILAKISNNCKNLKSLLCSIYTKNFYDLCVQPAYSFENVELLTLNYCNQEDVKKSFFDSFRRLKSVNIIQTFIHSNELKTIFQNNPSIESFVYDRNDLCFDCQLFEFIPNVTRLSLIKNGAEGENILKLDSLLKLNRLIKLRLEYEFLSVNKFLRALATKGIIEELELSRTEIDKDFLDILASFSKLQLLVLCAPWDYYVIKFPISWPALLKQIRLSFFQLTKKDLITMIQQLESIENIDIGLCIIASDDIHSFNDVAKLSQEICNIMNHSNRKQRLDVFLPDSLTADPSKKYLVESERVRILHYRHDTKKRLIKIHFPGAKIHFPGLPFLLDKYLPID